MPIIDQNRLSGNAGASHVAALLSRHCLVRPVATDTDVGVDLYCETLEDSQPFLHFWVQVKSGAQCRVTPSGSAAACRFDSNHVEYWSRQPVPVFAALVPPAAVGEVPSVYVVGISQLLLESDLDADAQSRVLASQWVWRPGNDLDVRCFLDRVIPQTTALLQMRDGVVGKIPTLRDDYFKSFPYGPIDRFGEEILTQIRRTAALSVLTIKEGRVSPHETKELRQRLERVLAQFDDDDHWETYAARAFSCHLDLRYQTAVECYEKAIEVIHSDPNTSGSSAWAARVAALEQDKQRAARREALPLPPF